jgi:hypothetical protein
MVPSATGKRFWDLRPEADEAGKIVTLKVANG